MLKKLVCVSRTVHGYLFMDDKFGVTVYPFKNFWTSGPFIFELWHSIYLLICSPIFPTLRPLQWYCTILRMIERQGPLISKSKFLLIKYSQVFFWSKAPIAVRLHCCENYKTSGSVPYWKLTFKWFNDWIFNFSWQTSVPTLPRNASVDEIFLTVAFIARARVLYGCGVNVFLSMIIYVTMTLIFILLPCFQYGCIPPAFEMLMWQITFTIMNKH